MIKLTETRPILKIQSLCILAFLMLFSSLKAQEGLKIPPALKKGDTIAIVAPAGILKYREAAIKKAKELADSWGLNVILRSAFIQPKSSFLGYRSRKSSRFSKSIRQPKH